MAISVYILLHSIPTNSTRGFPFFHTLSPHIIMAIDDGLSDWCEVIPHCSSDLHFSDNEWCWASFHVFISHLYCLLRRSVWIFCPLFDWVVCFLGVELQELLVYFSKIDSQWEFTVWLGELKPVLCDNLEGMDWVGSGREVQEGGDKCIPMADSCWWTAETNTIF